MDIEDILVRGPVNNLASIVTSQSGCVDSIQTTTKERRDALGAQKRRLADFCKQLKKEIGINRVFKKGMNVPPHIFKNPKYALLMETIEKLTVLDAKIVRLKKEPLVDTFQQIFIDKVKKKHPDIYEDIKNDIIKRMKKEYE